jgi:hypothetical protein
VLVCHSDFRIADLKAGEEKHIRGENYILPADIDVLFARYGSDFMGGRNEAIN